MISRSSEYAIRALTFLARQDGERYYLARDMAETLGIPAPFLGKVLQPLVSRGILDSQRGRSGGFRLARPAGEVRLLDIVETQESLEHLDRCILGQAQCTDERPCPLHDYWRSAAADFMRVLKTTTLRTLLEHGRKHPHSSYPFPTAASSVTSLSDAKAAEGHHPPSSARVACF
jgi:Rrf2 family protein